MEESDHSLSSADTPLRLRGVEHPTSTNRADEPSDAPILPASTVPKEEVQTSGSASYIVEEDTCEPVDEALRVDLPTESADIFLHLQNAVTSEEVEVLSRHKSTGERILEELVHLQSENTNCIDITRIGSIASLMERANTARTVLGVVGGTGHGKSSLINALLGEEKLVSNCRTVHISIWRPLEISGEPRIS